LIPSFVSKCESKAWSLIPKRKGGGWDGRWDEKELVNVSSN